MARIDQTYTELTALAMAGLDNQTKRAAVAQTIAPCSVIELIMLRRRLAEETGNYGWTHAISPPSAKPRGASPKAAPSDAKPAHLTERARAPRGRWWIP